MRTGLFFLIIQSLSCSNNLHRETGTCLLILNVGRDMGHVSQRGKLEPGRKDLPR
jgi:hypothetical protein